MARPSRPLLIALLLSLAMLAVAGLYCAPSAAKLPRRPGAGQWPHRGRPCAGVGQVCRQAGARAGARGDSVSAGQVLAELDDSQIRAKVAQAEASVAALQAQLKVAEQQVPLAVASARAMPPARRRRHQAQNRARRRTL